MEGGSCPLGQGHPALDSLLYYLFQNPCCSSPLKSIPEICSQLPVTTVPWSPSFPMCPSFSWIVLFNHFYLLTCVIYFWLCWVFTAAQASIVSGLWSPGSVVVTHGLSCSSACGIFPFQGWNLYLLYWLADSLPLSHRKALDSP